MHRANRKGTILITLIVAMLLMGVLGAGIYSLTTTSTFTGLLSNRNDQAYQLAQAGVRYAVDKLLQANPNYSSTDFLLPDSNHKFNITIVNSVITSVGIVNADTLTFFETRRQITYDVNASWSSGGAATLPTPQNSVISLSTDAGSFTPSQSVSGAITVNGTTGTITLGGSVGGNSGTILYQGSSSVANCLAGACNFNYGLNAYFEFTANEDHATDIGDGFTFGVFSAINNMRDRSGGAPSGVDMGSLMGYAGSGRTSDGLGLKPPKMAVEFDLYMNDGAIQYNGCSGNRNDNPNGLNHIALLFWGLNPASGTMCSGSSTAGSSYPQASWDDNVHGAGDGTSANPYNSAYTGNGSGSGYYEGIKDADHTTCKTLTSPSICNWMEDGYKYGFRLEIARATAGDTTGLYQINGWIYRLDLAEAPTDAQLTQFKDVTNSYFPYMTGIPQISKTITLSATNHANLAKIYWGFTEATGAANENIQVSKLDVFFPQTLGPCLYAINPPSAAYARAGGSGTVSVSVNVQRPDTPCTWTAVSNSSWIHITSGGSGTGNGTVNYTVDANATGLLRAGSMTIAGKTFAVTQSYCTGYRVWNNTGSTWDFKVGALACRTNRATGSEITNGTAQLTSTNSIVNRFTTAGGGCSSAVQGDITYTDAVSADINGNCQVNYNLGDVAGER